MSIGHQYQDFTTGFPGIQNTYELESQTKGEATLVELYAKRHLGSRVIFGDHCLVEQFKRQNHNVSLLSYVDIDASSGKDKSNHLYDGVILCNDDDLFKHLKFNDHHDFSQADINNIIQLSESENYSKELLLTEKDFYRLSKTDKQKFG